MRPQPGIATKPAPKPGLSRPSLQGRPTTLPGQIDRPSIGDGNNFWNNGTIGSGNWGNNNNFNNINVGGGWGLPGYGLGYGGGAGSWNAGYVNPRYGWYNGCWGGNWGYNGGWWAPFAVGAATWGLASTLGTWGWGYAGGYANPYYSSIPAAVVAASPYDYSQPVVVNNSIINDGDITDADADGMPPATAADAVFDAALAAFKKGDYAAALAGCDKAVAIAPQDSVIHEVRALSLFALARYPEAAATLNALLAAAPGMDWTTMSSLYGSVDAYTQHLRKLEDFCRTTPDSAAGHFVLAYHYLVGGHAEMAADALRVVVAKQPGDVVAKRLLEAIDPQKKDPPGASDAPEQERTRGSAIEPSAGPPPALVGLWKATSGKDSVELAITEDSRFTWKATPAGRPAVEIAGTVEAARDAIALVSESAGTMTGQVAAKGADAFDFTLAGAPPGATPIAFQRRK
jgi:tetratricopeptide (TPR) repeat protein